jgi:hypothetical protein
LGGSCDQDKGRNSAQESTVRTNRREKPSWKTQKKMLRCSGQGYLEDVNMQEIEKEGRGWISQETEV